MSGRILIANRGEIALRIVRACRAMGIETVVVHSEADRDAGYVALADRSLCIGPAAARRSYLNAAAILLAAEVSGAQAIHPGYGFLSENADFAQQVEDAGLVFIGPKPQSIRTMGDKIAAKRTMIEAKVPCIPGPDRALPDDPKEIAAIADGIGYPLIVKAGAGGGGRGMRVVSGRSELGQGRSPSPGKRRGPRSAIPPCTWRSSSNIRATSKSRSCAIPMATPCWLGDRDCSLQRRHQKVVEESPAPGIARATIEAIGERCVEACRRIGYRGVGTFEFLYEDDGFHFIEMNTRLQVGAPRHRDDVRHRHRPAADRRRLRRPAGTRAGGHRPQRPRHRMPDQCRGSRNLRPGAGGASRTGNRPRATAFASTAMRRPDTWCRPITIP